MQRAECGTGRDPVSGLCNLVPGMVLLGSAPEPKVVFDYPRVPVSDVPLRQG